MLEKNYCKQCEYYLQHYTFVKGRTIMVYCGHCTYGTARRRHPDKNACEAFASKAGAEVFVSKEYLTKALLQRVLDMDLLPPIEDATGSKIR